MLNRKFFLLIGGLSLLATAFFSLAQAGETAGAPTILFTDSGQSLGNEFSTGVALGDLDGDGDQDAFVTNGSGDQNQVWLNQGGAQGGTEGIYQDSGQTLSNLTQRGLALGDLDGDTDLDAFLVRGIAADSYQVWINQGAAQGGTPGLFLRNTFSVDDDLGSNIVLGDVDGDMDLDAYIPHVFDSDKIYLNDGTGFFTDSGQSLEPADALGADLADVDGDGDLDVFVAVNSGANTVWLNQGGLQGGAEGIFLDSGQALGNRISMDVVLGDLDHDNDMDAFVANGTENIVWINQGGTQGGTPGVFQENGQELGFSGSLDVKLADLDGDDDLDAFVAESGANTVWVNQGGDQGGTLGMFTDSGLTLGDDFSRGVALADVDGDGDTDAFIANSGPAPNKVYLNGSVQMDPVNPEAWQIQLVAARGDTGYSPSIALDSNGYPHIAHVTHVERPDGNSQHLNHMYWDGLRWHDDFVTAVGRIGETISLALDSQDNPHIAFVGTGVSSMGLTYAYWDGGQWHLQAIDNNDARDNVSMALDSNDYPHVFYAVDTPDKAYKYAAWDGGMWQIQTVETVNNFTNTYASLALDNNARPHLVYLNQVEGALKHAYYDGNNWYFDTVDSTSDFPDSGPFFSLAVFEETPSIAYYANFGESFKYAQWDGVNWQVQTVLPSAFLANLTGALSLAIDSDGYPHISYAYDENTGSVSLRYAYWDGAQWQNEILDNSGNLGKFNAITLNAGGTPHIAYQDQTFRDLRYVTWAPNWQIRTVADPGQMSSVDVEMHNTIPYLGYYNLADGFVQLARWDDTWGFTPADFVSSPVTQVSLAVSENFQHLSYYDADAQALMYGRYNGFGWVLQPVDNLGDVGRYNQLLLAAGAYPKVHIAYWDETNLQIKLAVEGPTPGSFQLYTNTAAPGMAAGSGPLSAAGLPGGDIGIAYYDALNTGLRFSVWDAETGTWTDELVDSAAGDIGQLNSVQMDGECGCPVIAYYDETNDVIHYADKDAGGWQFEIVRTNAGGVTSLSLELGLNSRQHPRIAYTTATESHLAMKLDGAWKFERIAVNLDNPGAAALALDFRPHIAYPDVVKGLQYVFRTATLDVDTTVPGPPVQAGYAFNPLSACPLIADFFYGPWVDLTKSNSQPANVLATGTTLDDLDILESLGPVFGATSGGQHYIDLYRTYGPEMGQLGLNDPLLLWDAFSTLQNFLPGLEALVTGSGDDVVVTQEMVDAALDIWTRLATAGSPDLADTINTELAQYNNLQDFAGLTFDEWAIAIGVNPPADHLYLPIIKK